MMNLPFSFLMTRTQTLKTDSYYLGVVASLEYLLSVIAKEELLRRIKRIEVKRYELFQQEKLQKMKEAFTRVKHHEKRI